MKFKVIHIKQLLATVIVAVLVLGAMGIKWYIRLGQIESVDTKPMKGKVVLIDPGHGGFDSGATANGAVEKEINLEVSKHLKEFVEAGGGMVYLTRETDVDTADPNRDKGTSQKKSDLQSRKSDIKKYNADIFISIHMNKFEQSQYHGAQVFYDDSSEESKFLAENIQQSLKDTLNDGNKRVAKGTGENIFILKNNEVPSALVECGFLSNRDEAEMLKKPEYQKQIAEGIYRGILNFYSKQSSNKN